MYARPRPTDRFSRQHEELNALAKTLLMTLDTRTLEIDPGPARKALAAFSGRLRVHAAMEQEALYPRLLASGHAPTVAKARELLNEVGDIYQLFFAFVEQFADGEAIRRDPEGFSRETMKVLHRLRLRMKRENEELYPLVNALDPSRSGVLAAVRIPPSK
jgi:hypothetical protein